MSIMKATARRSSRLLVSYFAAVLVLLGSLEGVHAQDSPPISNVQVSPEDIRATVTWETGVPSDSQVDFGTTSSYGRSTSLDTALVTSHTQELNTLEPDTKYFFRVKSRNADGILATQEGSFTNQFPGWLW